MVNVEARVFLFEFPALRDCLVGRVGVNTKKQLEVSVSQVDAMKFGRSQTLNPKPQIQRETPSGAALDFYG